MTTYSWGYLECPTCHARYSEHIMTSTNSFHGPPCRESPLRQCSCGSLFLAYEAFTGWAAREPRRYDLDFGPSDAPRAAFVRREQLPVFLARAQVRSNPALELEVRHAIWLLEPPGPEAPGGAERENVERLIALMRERPRPDWQEIRRAYVWLGAEAVASIQDEDWFIQLQKDRAASQQAHTDRGLKP